LVEKENPSYNASDEEHSVVHMCLSISLLVGHRG
jgi:hypothetical protein